MPKQLFSFYSLIKFRYVGLFDFILSHKTATEMHTTVADDRFMNSSLKPWDKSFFIYNCKPPVINKVRNARIIGIEITNKCSTTPKNPSE